MSESIKFTEEEMDILKKLILELETRTDWNERQKSIYNKIRLTLTGEFHKIVFNKLEDMGLDINTIQMDDPLQLIIEAKEKYERKQLNSID